MGGKIGDLEKRIKEYEENTEKTFQNKNDIKALKNDLKHEREINEDLEKILMEFKMKENT